jgi:exonuclease III
MDWKDMMTEVKEASDMPVNASFIGDDIAVKGDCVGCRMISFNAHRSLMQVRSVDPTNTDLSYGVNYAHELSKVLVTRSVDLAVIHEPGIRDWAAEEATLLSRMDGDWRLRYVQRPSSKRCNSNYGGVLIIMSPQWESAIAIDKSAGNTELVTVPLGDAPESDRLVVLEFLNPLNSTPTKERRYNERLMVPVVYGFNTGSDRGNPWGSNKVPQAALMRALTKCTHQFRDKYPKASVVVAGDLNFASSSSLDVVQHGDESSVGCSDLHADCSLIEAGSEMGTELAGLGLVDVFRELHPWVRAVTRYGSTNQNHCARRLDQFWLTHELAQPPAVRVAMDRHTGSLPSDHRMVTCDLPLDVANTAGVSLRVWDPVVQRKLQLIEGVSKNQDALKVYRERIAEWCSNARQWLPLSGATCEREVALELDSRFDELQGGIKHAATHSVLKVKRIVSPKWVKRVKDMTTADWRLSRRRAVLRNVSEMVRAGSLLDEISTVAHGLPPEPQLSDADKQSIGQMVSSRSLIALVAAAEPSELLSVLQEECVSLDSYLTKAARNARAAIAREKVSHRRALFDEGRVRATVHAVYRASAPVRALTRLVTGDGAVLTASCLIAAHVHKFVSSWFGSKVHVSDRFGSVEAVLQWDKTYMPARVIAAVELFYEVGVSQLSSIKLMN